MAVAPSTAYLATCCVTSTQKLRNDMRGLHGYYMKIYKKKIPDIVLMLSELAVISLVLHDLII